MTGTGRARIEVEFQAERVEDSPAACTIPMTRPLFRHVARRKPYVPAVSAARNASKKATAAKLRSWRVSIIRKRGQYLGTIEAPNVYGVYGAFLLYAERGDERSGMDRRNPLHRGTTKRMHEDFQKLALEALRTTWPCE